METFNENKWWIMSVRIRNQWCISGCLKTEGSGALLSANIMRQECIPVGYVPPAHWPYLRISSYPTHDPPQQPRTAPQEQPCTLPPGETTHPPSNHARPPRSNHACPPPPEQPRTPPQSNHACPPGATTHAPSPGATTHAPSPGATTHAPSPGAITHAPPVNRMNDRHVLKQPSQTTFAGGKYTAAGMKISGPGCHSDRCFYKVIRVEEW